eukprot:Hpha_TRINITY_DN26971_c0_g1::TRINITY_DN26971_c0_g1_i1::g.24889::m.24889
MDDLDALLQDADEAHSQQQQQYVQPPQHHAPPSRSHAVIESALSRLSLEQLRMMQHSSGAYNCFLYALPPVQEVLQVKEDLQSEVEKQAVQNCGDHDRLGALQQEIADLKQQAAQRRLALTELQRERLEKANGLTADAITRKLDECIAAADQRGESLSENFNAAGGKGVETFLRDFQVARREAYMLRFKRDQMPALTPVINRARSELLAQRH